MIWIGRMLIFSVFAYGVVSDWMTGELAQFFKKQLQFSDVDRGGIRQVLVGVGEREELVIGMKS